LIKRLKLQPAGNDAYVLMLTAILYMQARLLIKGDIWRRMAQNEDAPTGLG